RATSARPLNADVRGLPFGDCAIRSPTMSEEAMTRPAAPVYLRKSLRVGVIYVFSNQYNAELAELAEKNLLSVLCALCVHRLLNKMFSSSCSSWNLRDL